MPEKITKVKGGYRVSTPGGVKAKKTTKKKAEAQARLLRAVEHGWEPSAKRSKGKKSPKRRRGAYDELHGEFIMRHGVEMP